MEVYLMKKVVLLVFIIMLSTLFFSIDFKLGVNAAAAASNPDGTEKLPCPGIDVNFSVPVDEITGFNISADLTMGKKASLFVSPGLYVTLYDGMKKFPTIELLLTPLGFFWDSLSDFSKFDLYGGMGFQVLAPITENLYFSGFAKSMLVFSDDYDLAEDILPFNYFVGGLGFTWEF